jgi:hypothetical protein
LDPGRQSRLLPAGKFNWHPEWSLSLLGRLASPAIESLEQGELKRGVRFERDIESKKQHSHKSPAIKHRLYYENPVLYLVSQLFFSSRLA